MLDQKQLIEMNAEAVRKLSFMDRQEVLRVRKAWLKEQRENDVKEVRRREQKVKSFLLRKRNICRRCKKKEVTTLCYCKECYEKYRKYKPLHTKIIPCEKCGKFFKSTSSLYCRDCYDIQLALKKYHERLNNHVCTRCGGLPLRLRKDGLPAATCKKCYAYAKLSRTESRGRKKNDKL